MLKVKKSVKIPLIAGGAAIGRVFLWEYLTFVPEYSQAVNIIETPVMGEGSSDKRTLSEITYMQEMTSGICERSKMDVSQNVYESKQLIDKRDGKYYWVTKLGDGRCWMTQNLDLDITEEGLTAELSDMDKDWNKSSTSENPSRKAPVNTITKKTDWDTSLTTQAYDPGYVALLDGTKSEEVPEGLAYGLASEQYDIEVAHYLQGNYYPYNAATAGSGDNANNGDDAEYSICPKGWQLPVSGSNNGLSISATSGSLGRMLAEQLIEDNQTGANEMLNKPLYFVRGGVVAPASPSSLPSYVGSRVYYWSSSSFSTITAYGLYSNGSVVWPADKDGFSRGYGMLVRCVARDDVEDVKTPEIDNPNILVDVQPILTLAVNDKEVDLVPEVNGIATGEFIATVSSNAGYTLSLSAEEPDLVREDLTQRIPAIGNEEDVVAGTRGWGIRTCANNNIEECNNKYIGLTTSLVPYAESASGVYNKETLFQVGVGIDSSLPSGTYGTTVTVTANTK